MTTIACNRESIACDLQVTSNNNKYKVTTKIYSFDPHPKTYHVPYMVGFSGHVQKATAVIDWLANPEGAPPKFKDGEFLALGSDGKIFVFQIPVNWVEIDQPYCAIGSGAEYARGALASGKTPLEAVKIASNHDINTGMGFQEFNW